MKNSLLIVFYVWLSSMTSCISPSNPIEGLKAGVWVPELSEEEQFRLFEEHYSNRLSHRLPAFLLVDSTHQLISQGLSESTYTPTYQNGKWELWDEVSIQPKDNKFSLIIEEKGKKHHLVNYKCVVRETENPITQEELVGTAWELNPTVYNTKAVIFKKKVDAVPHTLIAKLLPTGIDSAIYYSNIYSDDYFLEGNYIGYNIEVREGAVGIINVAPIMRNYKFAIDRINENKDTMYTVIISPPYMGVSCIWTRIN